MLTQEEKEHFNEAVTITKTVYVDDNTNAAITCLIAALLIASLLFVVLVYQHRQETILLALEKASVMLEPPSILEGE